MAQYDKVIPPGQEGRIELAVEGKKVHGSFTKSATVYSNDTNHPTLTITLSGHEIPYVNVTPTERVHLQGRYGEKASKTIRVRSNEKDLDFKVTGLTSNIDDKITYRLEKTSQKGEYKIHVMKNPRLPTLSTFGSLFIHTNSELAPETTVQVQVITKGSISVQPSTVNFGRMHFPKKEVGTPVTKSVTLLKPNGGLVIEAIEVTNNNYKVELEEIVPGKRYKVNVTFTPPAFSQPRQREHGELTVFTNDPTEPRVTVRLVANGM